MLCNILCVCIILITLSIFFIPSISYDVYYNNYFEGTYIFNIYNLINFNMSSYVTCLSLICVFIFIVLSIYFIILILNIIDSYKLILYRNLINKILLIISILLFVLCFAYLITTICYVKNSGGSFETFHQIYHFKSASVILFIISLTNMLSFIFMFKRRKL